MSDTTDKLREAKAATSNAVQALRDANTTHTDAILGDVILDLIGQAAELNRRVQRLHQLVNFNENKP